jgi:hypothetical protein
LNKEFSSQGLSVVSLTSEGPDKTEPWIESKGVEYAYAYDKGGKLSRALGVSGIPNAVLVDASGKIIWQGHPSGINAELIAKAVQGAISTPVYEWGDSAKNIKKAFLKGDFGGAIKAADSLAEKEELGVEIGKMLRNMVAARVATVEADLQQGEVLKAYEAAKALAKNLKGLPEEDTVKALYKSISDDKGLKKAMKTQEKLIDILATERDKMKECDELIKDMEKLLKSSDHEYTNGLIEQAIKDMQEERRQMTR